MMQDTIRNREKTILLVIFTTFMGQIYLQPFESDFRLTLAVVVINVAFLVFKEIPPLLTINTVGLLMLLVRSSVYAFERKLSLLTGIDVYWPVLLFYCFYGLLFVLLKVRSAVKQPLLLIISLWFCDSIPNIIEFIVRKGWTIHSIENAIYTIVAIGLIRAILSTLLYYGSQYYVDIVRERRRQQSFVDSVLFLSNLRTELFFLKKSKNDIEEAMRKSYMIYEQMDEPLQRQQLLEVTKDIHEIKKDYTRVISGIERHLQLSVAGAIEEQGVYTMSMAKILDIVVDANQKVAHKLDKQIDFQVDCQYVGQVHGFYAMISTLNNLVINGIEAIQGSGQIQLTCTTLEHQMTITVRDSAGSLPQEMGEVIFNPGFSTKYHRESGVMNAGVGLTHVKQIVEDVFGGTIEVRVETDVSTAFVVSLPLSGL